MSVKRDSVPPPRPPAPKSLTRRSASNNSIKKSFKLLEEDEEDEEDLTVLTGEFDRKLDKSKAAETNSSKGDRSKETTPVKTPSVTPQNESKTLGPNQRSKSLDDDRASSNVSRIKQNFVDISSGLKDKITKKWEEISAERSSSEIDSDLKSEEKIDQNVKIISEDIKSLEIRVSANGEETLVIETAKTESSDLPVIKDESEKRTLVRSVRLPPTPEEVDIIDSSGFQMIDDFYTTEPKEISTESTPTQSTELRQRNTNTGSFKKLKGKGSKVQSSPTETPVSMSKLMTKKDSEDMADENIEPLSTNAEFFDASDLNVASKNSSKPTPALKVEKKPEEPSRHVKIADLNVVPVRKLAIGSVFLFFYWILPLPTYVSGMLMGAFIASAGWGLYVWLTKPPVPKPPIEKLPFSKLPPMVVPEMKDVVTEDGVYKVSIFLHVRTV